MTPRQGPSPGGARLEADAGLPPKMKRKAYERQMRVLHGELVALQEWVKASGAKICIVFEGRDTAGKGGTIKRITERVSPRVFRVVALPAPTEREKSQMYIQRYLPHFPAAGDGGGVGPDGAGADEVGKRAGGQLDVLPEFRVAAHLAARVQFASPPRAQRAGVAHFPRQAQGGHHEV